MENETNNQNEVKTEKKSNKTLIIILSVVGGVLLLGGIIFAVLINTIFKTATSIIDNEIDNGIEVANKIIEEAKETQKEIIDEAKEKKNEIIEKVKGETVFTYSDVSFNVEVKGTGENDDPSIIYINGTEIENPVDYANKFSVEKINNYYVLFEKSDGIQMERANNALIFDENGTLIKTLTGIFRLAQYCEHKVENDVIVQSCGVGTVVYCKGDPELIINYYVIEDGQVILDHTDKILHEKDSLEDACNERRAN